MTTTPTGDQPKPRPPAHQPRTIRQPVATAGFAAVLTRLDAIAAKLDKLEQLPATVEHLHADLGTLAEILHRPAEQPAPGARTAGCSHAA